MKKLRVLLMLLFGILLLSCDKEDNEKVENDLKLNKNFLSQTAWKGKIIWDIDDRITPVGLLFTTENRGSYEERFWLDDSSLIGNFSYSLNNKLLTINPENDHRELGGDWFLAEINKSKDQLVFKRDIQSNKGVYSLELTRIY